MKPRSIQRASCALGLHASLLVTALAAQEHSIVNTQSFDIEYNVNEAALPLTAVTLWLTADGGGTWTEFGHDEDRLSPIRFRATAEGLLGFYLVMTNSSGPSGPAPKPGTRPQQTVLVDFTPPLVQLHQVRSVPGIDDVTVQIRWTAIDAHFGPRPIEVLYGSNSEDVSLRATPDPVANTGMLDWRVPHDVTGSIAVIVAATDRAGQRVQSEAFWVEVNSPQKPLSVQTVIDDPVTRPPADDSALAGSNRARSRAVELLAAAKDDHQKGRLVDGVARLREAVKLDPQLTAAFTEMGAMLLTLGDLDRAAGAYEIAVRQQPGNRDAIRGMARIQERKSNFSAAAQQLQTILRYNPKDAEVWLQLGDVAVHQGDEIRARECYLRAAQIDPQAVAIITDARARLELMSELSRSPGLKKK